MTSTLADAGLAMMLGNASKLMDMQRRNCCCQGWQYPVGFSPLRFGILISHLHWHEHRIMNTGWNAENHIAPVWLRDACYGGLLFGIASSNAPAAIGNFSHETCSMHLHDILLEQ